MKIHFSFALLLIVQLSCTQPNNTVKQVQEKENSEFFPVGNYIKGQLIDIQNKGITPIKFIKKNEALDSSWIKTSQMESEFSEYTEPSIDSITVAPFFTVKKFFDQTLNLITLSYDPTGPIPDSIPWRHWDIYIDPETNTIKRIYLVKSLKNNSIRQLTWITGKYCKAITIEEDLQGKSTISNEVIIKWGY